VYLGLPCLTLFDAFHQLFVLLQEINASQQTSPQFLHTGVEARQTTHLNRHSKPGFYDASLFFLLPGLSQTMLQRQNLLSGHLQGTLTLDRSQSESLLRLY